MPSYVDLSYLREFATARQLEYLEAIARTRSQRKAASEMGVNTRTITEAIASLKAKAAKAGIAPGHFVNGVAPGFEMGKVTIQRNAEGQVERVWERQSPGKEQSAEDVREAAREFFGEFKPIKTPPAAKCKGASSDLIPWFQIGDAHIGMVAWAFETGHNFDLDIGARELLTAFKILVERAPAAERCVINDLGDFTHYENYVGETERSRNRLDMDGRFPKMIRVVSRLWRGMLEIALSKYQNVDVIINQGNHSRTNDIHIAQMIEFAYEKSDRVKVLDNASVFIPYRMGQTFVVTHHSDKASGKRLVEAVLTDFRDQIRDCRHIYVDTGHIHHHMVSKEYGLVQVTSWNNLAPNDAHHHDHAWRSKQSMSCAIRSRKYGQLDVLRVCVEEVWERLARSFGPGVETSRPERAVYTV